MAKGKSDLLCFSSIELTDPVINGNKVNARVILNTTKGDQSVFDMKLAYAEQVNDEVLPILRLAFVMPLLNYGLFSKKIQLNFSISRMDFELLHTLNQIFSSDIFVNKILRRKANYILPEYLPDPEQITISDARPKAVIKPKHITNDSYLATTFNPNSCGVLSSGGKESLLSYGLLHELGCRTYPFYVNESGGHWRTALPAYRFHTSNEKKTQRVWTNIDRFYLFMLDHLSFIRSDHRKIRADTYPIRLCIFPFYVFLFLPQFIKNQIGNLLIGSEFDDIRETQEFLGIRHYYGVYDQHQDFDMVMNNWYNSRLPGLFQWSALRTISGLIVERILANRFPQLAKFQRSCHSCHFEHGNIYPCGSCSKCNGVLLFLLANNIDPKLMNFKDKNITQFLDNANPDLLRLDEDEKLHSFYLLRKTEYCSQPRDHVEKIHLNKATMDIELVPEHLRKQLFQILKIYTTGYCRLENKEWISVDDEEIVI